MFYEIPFLPQVKRCAIMPYKNGIYEMPQEFPNDLKIYDLRKFFFDTSKFFLKKQKLNFCLKKPMKTRFSLIYAVTDICCAVAFKSVQTPSSYNVGYSKAFHTVLI